MKDKESLMSVLVILLVLCMLSLSFCVYLIYDKNQELEKYEDIREEEKEYEQKLNTLIKKNEKTKLSEQEIQDLYEQFIVLEEPYSSNFGYFYKIDKKLQSKDFTDEVKIILSINKLLKEKYHTNLSTVASNSEKYSNKISFSKEEITKTVKELFGENVSYKDVLKIMVVCASFEFKNNAYILNTGSGCGGPIPEIDRKITQTNEENDKLIVKEKYMFKNLYDYNNKEKKIENRIYKNILKDGSFSNNDFIDSYFYDKNYVLAKDISIDHYLNKLNTLQYNFVKNKVGKYYLESVELKK